MTRIEAAKVMTVLAAAFSHKLTDDELEVWYGAALENVDAFLGGMVAQRLVSEDHFWPTPARFSEMRRAVERSQEPAVKALDEAPVTEAEFSNRKRLIGLMRETLVAQARKEHWHGGPGPCPVCGGITDDPKTLARYAKGRPEVATATRVPVIPKSNGHTFKGSNQTGWHCECGYPYETDERESWLAHLEHKQAQAS